MLDFMITLIVWLGSGLALLFLSAIWTMLIMVFVQEVRAVINRDLDPHLKENRYEDTL